MRQPLSIWGSGLFFCFGIKTWGNWGTSNWWLLRERGFLRSFREQAGHTGYFTPVGSSKSHIPSIQGVLPLWAPQKAIWPPYRVFYPCVLLKKPFGTQYNGIFYCFHCFTPNWLKKLIFFTQCSKLDGTGSFPQKISQNNNRSSGNRKFLNFPI